MSDIAASVLGRLQNKAKETGRSYQLCLQLFCQEEFLRRLEKSRYKENFVLKGGLFLYSLTNFDSRVTVDIDFLLRRIPNTVEQAEFILKEIINTSVGNDFVTYKIIKIEPIAIKKKYIGVGVSLLAQIKNTKTTVDIDFGFGDVIVPHQTKCVIPTQLDGFYSPTINTYTLETTIAEKTDAILNFMEFSSRMKDYYDIWYLASNFNFDGATLTEALQKTFENRNHCYTVEQFKQVMSFDTNEAMLVKWKAFCKKTSVEESDYSYVLKEIGKFLEKPFAAAVNGSMFQEFWNFSNQMWYTTSNTKKETILHVIVDRPLGSSHPDYPSTVYPVNYGYVENAIGGDGEKQDVYILGIREPIKEFDGKLIAIIHRKDDIENKWVACPFNQSYSLEEIETAVSFMEQYFTHSIEML